MNALIPSGQWRPRGRGRRARRRRPDDVAAQFVRDGDGRRLGHRRGSRRTDSPRGLDLVAGGDDHVVGVADSQQGAVVGGGGEVLGGNQGAVEDLVAVLAGPEFLDPSGKGFNGRGRQIPARSTDQTGRPSSSRMADLLNPGTSACSSSRARPRRKGPRRTAERTRSASRNPTVNLYWSGPT